MRSPVASAFAAVLLLAPVAAFAQTTTANPPGTAVGRAFDRAAGTDTSGAYPSQADGTAANPRGTVVSRAAHRATRHNSSRHAQNLRNNSATRGVDRAAGTDNSGAFPAQADGKPGNPPGTVVSRTLGTTNAK